MTHHFEDFRSGQVFLSQARTITEADVVTFAGWSWDTNPVHTDAESARHGRFGERIAHGVLGLSVAMGLASRLGVFESCSVALLGVDDWRFRRPLLIGDTVRCRVEILGTRLTSAGDAGILQRRFTLLNQREEVVQDGEIPLMVSLRPGT
ncbi:MaoC family dehydratase [Blastococcus sp. SYSU D00820]